MAEQLTIEVVLAGPTGADRRQVILETGTTVWQAVLAAGFSGTAQPDQVGVFGRRVGPDTPLRDGDRVEIYRPLYLDPREARRRRAAEE